MALSPGTRIGPYEIVSAIGAGGMGEVYAARDPRLNRRVALKVLTSSIGPDPERVARFRREAQAIAALNHPNIVTIHSVEEHEGVPFLTMELVEGRTLDELIEPRGMALPVLVPLAYTMAEALAAAHQRGVVHRDIKPANVMVTAEGRVKVLDFGLAKLRQPETASDDTTVLADGLTAQGGFVGTVSYMSPEQAEGRVVDWRSDIFSFGVMLHEMATGERPFRGDSSASIISAILRDDPAPVTEVRPELPVRLSRIIKRCLAKDPSARYQSAFDLGHDLRELTAPDAVSTPKRARSSMTRRSIVIGAAAALSLFAAGVVWVGLSNRAAPSVFEMERSTRLTSEGDVNVAAISPDGRNLVHVKYVNERPSLWVRQIGTTADVQIHEATDAPEDRRSTRHYWALTYTPDGSYIYFTSLGSLWRIPALGGPPRQIVENNVDSGVAFSPDGKRMAFLRGDQASLQTHVVTTDTGGTGEERIATIGATLTTPSWSPDGTSLLIVTTDFSGTAVTRVNVENGSVEQVTPTLSSIAAAVWLPDGKSFLMSAADTVGGPAQLWQVSLPSRERTRITNDVNSYSELSMSSDGRIVAAVQTETIATLRTLNHSGEGGTQLLSGRRDDGARGLAWSANDQILFASSRSGATELWSVQADGTQLRQLTENSGWAPVTSQDGRSFVFLDGHSRLWRGRFDDSAPTLLTTSTGVFHPMITRDGWVHYTSVVNAQPRSFRLSLTGGTPVETTSGRFFVQTDTLPSGDLVGCNGDEQQRRCWAAIKPAADGALRTLNHVAILPPLCSTLKAAPDGALSFIDLKHGRKEIWRQPIENGPAVQLTHSGGDDIFAYAWSPDGKDLVVSRGRTASDVVLIHQK